MLIVLRWFNLPVFTNNCSCSSVAVQIQSRGVTRSDTYNNFQKRKVWKCPGTCFFVFSFHNSICAVGSTRLSVLIYPYKLKKKEAETPRHRNTRGRCVAMAPPWLTDKRFCGIDNRFPKTQYVKNVTVIREPREEYFQFSEAPKSL